jgi:hypothetical protein
MDNENLLRKLLLDLLDGSWAHITVESTLSGFPFDRMNDRPAGSPHSAWELLEHIRIAQWDILEFSRDASHVSPDFPEGYWPKADGSAADWERSAEQVLSDLREMQELIADESGDLFTAFAHGKGQTLLREVMLAADHNSFHLGQLLLLRRMFESGKA